MVGPETARPRADERKLVTILFADLVGSPSLGEQLDPERLQVLLATYFGAMARVIEGWGGTVEKYIGEAIMAGRDCAGRVVWLPPAIEYAQALRLAANGDIGAAREGFGRALATYERLTMPVEAAEVREHLARLA